MLQPKLVKIEPVEPNKLRLFYETGEVKLFDVAPYIKGLSLIHISEPTRQEAISYAVFCL